MKHTNTIFYHLLSILPKSTFQKAVIRHKGDRRIRTLSCWTQFQAMLFAQLTARQSLRDIEASFNSQSASLYHLGVTTIKKSTLAEANNKRSPLIYEEVFYFLLGKVRQQLPSPIQTEMVRLIDSTTIDLNFNQFKWANFRQTKAGVKIHTVYDPLADTPVFFELTDAKTNDYKAAKKLPILSGVTYVFDRAYNDYSWFYTLTSQGTQFVGRMKSNAVYEIVEERGCQIEHILEDQIIRLTSATAAKNYPSNLRRVTIKRKEDNKVLSFITNDFERSAEEISELYKTRWQIELFFKWIKQNLKIKHFVGRSENAVKIQVLVAMISYLLLRLAQIGHAPSMSMQKIVRLIGLNTMRRSTLWELLNAPPSQTNTVEHSSQALLGF